MTGEDKTRGEEYSIPLQAVSGVFIVIFFVLGLAGNINVLYVLRRQQHILDKATTYILAHLAIFSLISCLVNSPTIFVTVLDDVSVRILSSIVAAVTLSTGWANCACLVLFALVRRDATIRAVYSQRITIQRLKMLLGVTWLIFAVVHGHISYASSTTPQYMSSVKTKKKIDAKILPLRVVLVVIVLLTVGFVFKSHYDITNFLKMQNNNIENHMNVYQGNLHREREMKLCKVMLQKLIVFAVVTVLPPVTIRFFHESVGTDGLVISKLFALIDPVASPFIYYTINEDFLRFLNCFRCTCLERRVSISENLHEDISPQRNASNGQDEPMGLEILEIISVDEEIRNSTTDSNSMNVVPREQKTRKHSRGTSILAEAASTWDSGNPSTSHAQDFVHSVHPGQWCSQQGRGMTEIDI